MVLTIVFTMAAVLALVGLVVVSVIGSRRSQTQRDIVNNKIAVVTCTLVFFNTTGIALTTMGESLLGTFLIIVAAILAVYIMIYWMRYLRKNRMNSSK